MHGGRGVSWGGEGEEVGAGTGGKEAKGRGMEEGSGRQGGR